MDVLHYTQLLARLLDEGRLNLTGRVEKVVTYHDPCFLGKQNRIFDEPREVLKAIPGVKFVEMDRIRERSLCCEGGGGRMWFEGTNTEGRLAFQRVQEAADTGGEILAVACPFCIGDAGRRGQGEGALRTAEGDGHRRTGGDGAMRWPQRWGVLDEAGDVGSAEGSSRHSSLRWCWRETCSR